MLEFALTYDIEVHSEEPSTETSIRAEINLESRNRNINLYSVTSKSRLVLIIRTLFYLSYIINVPTLNKNPGLAPLHKMVRIRIVSVWGKTLKTGCKYLGSLVNGANMFHTAGV